VSKTLLIIVITLLCAAGIRLYQLGVVPHGFTWDEAAIGYNGYAVVTTRRDEWLERLPVSFRSFGDYKAPLAIYINGVFTVPLGLNPLIVRLPFALAGVASVAIFYWLLIELFRFQKITHVGKLAVLGAAILTLSPWHILYSRTGFESGMALFFVLSMVALVLRAVGKSTKQRSVHQAVLFSLAGVSGVAAMYTYHSAKIVVPLLAIVLCWFFLDQLQKSWKQVMIAGALAVVLLLPMLRDSITGSGLERAGVTVFSREDSILRAVEVSATQLGMHLTPDFLLFGQTTTLRHGTGVWGVLQATTYLFVLISLCVALYDKVHHKPTSKVKLFFLLWVLIGLLPAAIATEVPHSHRSLLALPGFIGLAVLGVLDVFERVTTDSVRKMILGTAVCIHLLLTVSFLNYYFFTYSARSTADFYDGYLEAFSLAQQYEKGSNDFPEVDQIFVTSEYGQPYIFALFVRRTNPIWYQGGSLSEKYTFLDTFNQGDLARSNALLVAGQNSDLPEIDATHIVRGTDGSVRFKLYYVPGKNAE
jgi:4-amino-4-deoxy-L-arabinose transferase-like glycosyltransferase